ncbi:hypothetical protein Bbelb_047060 [Branchiostoma belcheri]|nr:hypothetical protein Bbelb_047060 [Branchiostoma belcheri]
MASPRSLTAPGGDMFDTRGFVVPVRWPQPPGTPLAGPSTAEHSELTKQRANLSKSTRNQTAPPCQMPIRTRLLIAGFGAVIKRAAPATEPSVSDLHINPRLNV